MKTAKRPPGKTTAKKAKQSASTLATYVYGVVKAQSKSRAAIAPPKIPKGVKGLPEAGAPRILDAAGDYHVVVSSVPLPSYSAESIEAKLRDLDWVGVAAAAHETVVERAAALGTVVPMKLFTIFTSDDRAIAHVSKMKRDLDRVVTKIAGCDEWGLRILFDEARALERKQAEQKRKDATGPITGKSFLLRKKAQEETRRVLTFEAKEEVDELFDRLERAARKAVRRPPPNRELAGRVLLDAVFLVPQKGVAKFKSTIAGTAKELVREGYQITLTGPWPAYSFVEAR
jgi:hypothetical protein